MPVFIVNTLNYTRRVTAKSFNDALRKAWRRNPPRKVGLLVQVKELGKPWRYLDGVVAVKRAGYPVRRAV